METLENNVIVISPEASVTTLDGAKKKKTRTVDYSRTNKTPHSFRYKRGHAFVPRTSTVVLKKESDGALVIGPLPNGVEAVGEPVSLGADSQLKLVSVKKRPNGKTAITFEQADGSLVVSYDARDARAALRSV